METETASTVNLIFLLWLLIFPMHILFEFTSMFFVMCVWVSFPLEKLVALCSSINVFRFVKHVLLFFFTFIHHVLGGGLTVDV